MFGKAEARACASLVENVVVMTEFSARGWKRGVSGSPCNVAVHVIYGLKIQNGFFMGK